MRITALMFVTMVVAALIVDGIFSALGLIPTGPRPTRADIFGSIQLDYKLVLNVLGTGDLRRAVLAHPRRGATDPVCGMTVDRAKASRTEHGGKTLLLLLRALPARVRSGSREVPERARTRRPRPRRPCPTTDPNPKGIR